MDFRLVFHYFIVQYATQSNLSDIQSSLEPKSLVILGLHFSFQSVLGICFQALEILLLMTQITCFSQPYIKSIWSNINSLLYLSPFTAKQKLNRELLNFQKQK